MASSMWLVVDGCWSNDWHDLTIAACLFCFDSLYILGCFPFLAFHSKYVTVGSLDHVSLLIMSFAPCSPISVGVVYNIIITRIFLIGTNFPLWFWLSILCIVQLGLGTVVMHYLTGLVSSLLHELGLGDDMFNPVSAILFGPLHICSDLTILRHGNSASVH